MADVQLIRFSDIIIDIILKKDGVVVDLTGYTVEIIEQSLEVFAVSITDATAGKLTVTMSSVDSAQLTLGAKHYFTCRIEDGAGIKTATKRITCEVC